MVAAIKRWVGPADIINFVEIDRLSFLQWTMGWTGSGWSFRNENTNTYLGIQGDPANGTPVVAVDSPFTWDIWRDETNPNTFR